MKNRLTLLLLLCSIVGWMPEAFGDTYYWVGGQGNWNDLSHWSTVSGSTNAADLHTTLPDQDDEVRFDGNSFTADGQEVRLNVNATCGDMIWTGNIMVKPELVFYSGRELNIHGQLAINSLIDVSSDPNNPGSVLMQSTSSATFAVAVFDGVELPNLEFVGAGGFWAITTNLTVAGDIIIHSGEVDAGAPSGEDIRTITTDRFIVDGSDVDLDISKMNITATSLFQIDDLRSFIHYVKVKSTDFYSAVTTSLFQINTAIADDFGSLNLIGTNPILDADGLSLEFHKDVTLEGTASNTVLGSHTFSGNLVLNVPWVPNKFEAGSTQTFGNMSNILANGPNCSNYFFLSSTSEGNAATFSKSGSAIQELTRFYIQDINTLQDNKFSAVLSIDLGNTDDWDITPKGSQDFYWDGGTGDWSESGNWAFWDEEDGLIPTICVPTANDNVFFIDASFTSSGQTVTADQSNTYFNNMTWTTTQKQNLTISSGNVFVGGSLTLVSNMTVSTPASSTFHFTSSNPGNTISAGITDINGASGHNLANVVFEGIGGWTLTSSLVTLGDIAIKSGTFDTGSNRLAGDKISIEGINTSVSLGDVVLTETFEIKSILSLTTTGSNIYATIFDITPTDGLEFNQLILQDSGSATDGMISGDNLTFAEVNLNNSGTSTVFGNHEYTNWLQFGKKGMTVEFEAGTVQVIKSLLTSLGNCGEEILVRTTESGNPVTFKAGPGAGNLELKSVLLKDNIADPNMQAVTFTASSSVNLGNNVGWDFTGSATTRYFYWRGGTGNWNTASNWMYATEPGVEPTLTNCLPTANDDVFFDAASFSGDGTITLDGTEQYCRNMIWQDDVNDDGTPTMAIPNNNDLYIFGFLRLASTDRMALDFGMDSESVFYFKARETDPETPLGVTLFTHSIPNITFDGEGGAWTCNGTQFNVDSKIQLLAGNLETSATANFAINANQFIVNGSGASLNLKTSVVDVPELFQIGDINTLMASNSQIGTNNFDINTEELAFGTVTLNDIGQLNIMALDGDLDLNAELSGNNLTFESLILSASNNNTVHGSHSFNQSLEFVYNNVIQAGGSPGFPFTDYTFDAGSTQTFSSTCTIFTSSDNPGSPLPINPQSNLRSSSVTTNAIFSKTGWAVCLENIVIYNNTATGGASFGYNSANAGVVGSSNWDPTTDCETFLPVDCTDFAAAVQTDNSVELYWITAQEVNNSGFEVQRSTDGRRFETIAWMDGAGTTSEAQKYTYLDRRTEGLTEAYYRIRQVDFDGTAAFACDIQAVNFRQVGNGPVQVFPNPAGEQVLVRWFGKKEGSTIIRLFDQRGRLVIDRVWSTLEGNNQRALPIAELPKGIYELQLVDENGQVEEARLVKQ